MCQAAHVVGEVLEADARPGPDKSDAADQRAAHVIGLGAEDVLDTGAPTPGPAPLAAMVEPEVRDVSTSGLIRVEAGEEAIVDDAVELRWHPQTQPGAPGVPLQPQLVRMRR